MALSLLEIAAMPEREMSLGLKGRMAAMKASTSAAEPTISYMVEDCGVLSARAPYPAARALALLKCHLTLKQQMSFLNLTEKSEMEEA